MQHATYNADNETHTMRHVACDARLGPAAGRKVRSLSHGLAWQLDWRDVSQKYFDRVQVGLPRRRRRHGALSVVTTTRCNIAQRTAAVPLK